jgi:hypothetical protein
MNKRSVFLGTLALLFAAAAGSPALPQVGSTDTYNGAPVAYTLTMGDMMNTLIQARPRWRGAELAVGAIRSG